MQKPRSAWLFSHHVITISARSTYTVTVYSSQPLPSKRGVLNSKVCLTVWSFQGNDWFPPKRNSLNYLLLSKILKHFIYLFCRERGRKRERKGEKHWGQSMREASTGCPLHMPQPGPGQQCRQVPWPGIKPASFLLVCRTMPNPLKYSSQGCFKILKQHTLAGVAQWIECWPANLRVTSLIPSQGTCLACGPGPQ